MAFYLRKAFKSGPVRFNLSKSGIGLSGGITGARLGLNSRGVYVHGGRHGLYYRKHVKKGRSTGKSPQTNNSSVEYTSSGPISVFINTGVTFGCKAASFKKSVRSEPKFPSSSVIFTKKIAAVIAISAFILLFALFKQAAALTIIALTLLFAALFRVIYDTYWKWKTESTLDEIIAHVENHKELPHTELILPEKMPERWQTWLSVSVHSVISEMAARQEDIDTAKTISELDSRLNITDFIRHDIRLNIVSGILDEMLENFELSLHEEECIRTLITLFDLPESQVSAELERINYFTNLRSRIEKPLQPVETDIELTRGEQAYEVFDPLRILNERVLKRYQRNNNQFRELGYEVDFEGNGIITNKRILVISRGTKEYRLNKIMDVFADPEAGTVELILSGRKSPVILTMDEPVLFAARLELVRVLD